MLYSVFLYESKSGIMMWDKNFDPSSNQQLAMFSSFFAAIKSFVREMVVLRGSRSETLHNIEMGTHIITLYAIKDLGVDLVFIADLDDVKRLKKITPKIVEILESHNDLFDGEFDGNLNKFNVFNKPIEDVLAKQKDLFDQRKSLTEDHEAIIKNLFNKKGKLKPAEIEALQTEREKFERQLSGIKNLVVKHQLLDQILQIDQRLADDENFLATARNFREVTQELEDVHYKLNYWLLETKTNLTRAIEKIHNTRKSLMEADYKDVYRSLLDFSANIKKIAEESVAVKFQVMARYLMDKGAIPPDILSQTIHDILNLQEDVFDVIKTIPAREMGCSML